ncbi:hypothetical protein B0T25DRAFT_574297 [Lasiosphaeria hispida]|uniref:AB hydrolase-1 domain-containing protein n=1 Tax=Lasiosphaeria hispida TaxID=260671 RepID=A0AAJ0M917_9PEZI|nr:hypothetical protein B0T25DRAFT_574297 [Lasiosphaeria hispida]
MAFMDIPPAKKATLNKDAPKTAVLLHGRNFCATTWQETASNLSAAGYRQLALNTHNLLTALAPNTTATVIGRSLGGMLAARYALMYPSPTAVLVLTNPIGLEDWKALGVPYQAIEATFESERTSTYASVREYQQATS